MTTKAKAKARNPAKELEQLRADMVAARVAADTLRANQMRGRTETRELEERRRKGDMDVLLNVAGAAEEHAEVLDRLRELAAAEQECERGLVAADSIIRTRQAQIAQLHTDPECFPIFAKQGLAKSAAAQRDLQLVADAVIKARESWEQAEAVLAASQRGHPGAP